MDQLEYYAYLAAKLPTGDLARAAVRKIARRAARAFQRRAAPDTREVLEAFCAHDPADLALKLAAPRASQLWADSTQRESVRAIAEQFPGMVDRALVRARAAWAREVEVFGTTVCFGRSGPGIDWQADALNQGSFAHQANVAAADVACPGLDPKAPWAVARMGQAVALGLGVWLSNSDEERARWASELVHLVRHFVRHNPPGLGVNWASPMEAALRATNLCLAYLMMRHRPELQDPGFAVDSARTLLVHGRFVDTHLESACVVPNNHLVADHVGLLHLGVVFPELDEARAWRDRAAEGLRAQIERQVLEDGFSFEGSVSYHRLVTELFTLALLAAEAGGIDLGTRYRTRLHQMYRAVRAYLAPSGLAPQFGDNDSGRAFALTDRPALDHAYLLPLGASLFADPDLKAEGASPSDEAIILLGQPGLERLRSLPESGLLKSTSLPKAGLYFLRSQDAYCAVSCGPNGQAGVGGHGHNDKLGLELHAGGRPVIVDTGTFCYTSHPKLRNQFRSTAAHSTVQIDGEEQSRIPELRLFALPDDARARARAFESSPMRERFVGEHLGYQRLSPPVRHHREIQLDRASRAFIVVDRLAGAGPRSLVSRFHLPHREARLRPASAAELVRLTRLGLRERVDAARVVEIGPESQVQAVLAAPSWVELRLAPAWCSPAYGVRVESVCVERALSAELPVELLAVILLAD